MRRLKPSRPALALLVAVAMAWWLVRHWRWGQASIPIAAYWEEDFWEREAPDTIAFINANGVVLRRIRGMWFWEPTIFHPGERALWIAGDRGISEWRDGTKRLVVPAPGVTEIARARTGRLAFSVPVRRQGGRSVPAPGADSDGKPLQAQDLYVGGEGLPPRLVAHGDGRECRNLSWSPDGRRLLFEDKGVVIVTFGSTLQEQSRQRLPESCSGPAAWAGGGTVLWQDSRARTRRLLKLDLRDEAKPQVLLERGELVMLAVSPDGRSVACATATEWAVECPVTHSLEIVDVRTGAVTRRLPPEGLAIDAAVWPVPDVILLSRMKGHRESGFTWLDTRSAHLVRVSPGTGRTRRLRHGRTMFVGEGQAGLSVRAP